MIILIAAASENNALGKENKLLWHLPHDFKRFKAITSGHYIIMGRKTFESFPKPLPNRTHIIITRQKNYTFPDCIIASNLENALELAPKNEAVFIIGGGEIYKQSIEIADKIYMTRVHATLEGDTFFPAIDETKFLLTHNQDFAVDEKHKYAYSFQTWERIQK